MLAVALPAGAAAIVGPTTNQGDAYPIQALFTRGPLTTEQGLSSKRWLTDRAVADYIDSLDPGRGAVLVDDFLGFVVVMASDHPDQFVITADRDFQSILADPANAHVQYLLVPPDRDLGSLDAINRHYPHVYDNGAGIAQLVREFHDVSDLHVDWKLYRVNPEG
jgi:hypothetical protein